MGLQLSCCDPFFYEAIYHKTKLPIMKITRTADHSHSNTVVHAISISVDNLFMQVFLSCTNCTKPVYNLYNGRVQLVQSH